MLDLSNLDIKKLSSIKLAEIIVCQRYFKAPVSTNIFEELSNRRTNGEIFDFESYIEIELNKLPQINTQTLDLKEIFSSIKI